MKLWQSLPHIGAREVTQVHLLTNRDIVSVCAGEKDMWVYFPYSGLNVTMPFPGHRYGVVRYSWLMVLRRNLLYKPLLTKLARQLAKEEKREVQKVQDTIMLFLLWRQNDGKLSNVCHVNISILGCLKEEYTVTNIFSPLSKSKLDSKSGILIKSQNLPINGSLDRKSVV